MGSWRAGCGATRTSGSAARTGKTDRPKGRHRAPARPIHFRVRLEQARLCCLVIVGVRRRSQGAGGGGRWGAGVDRVVG
jgi:hypothetical protein